MVVSQVDGDGFTHLVIQRSGFLPDSRLHVYIEGDGIPWSGRYPSADPTPRNALALRLANQDSTDIAYVGRPCYFGLTNTVQCKPKYWTSHRYGEEVIRSMAAAIQRIRQPQHTEIVLIGHSGGGVVAALLETRIDGVVGVITVGANLDIGKWTQHHHYDPLTGSLNPAEQERNSNIPHLQLVGGTDEIVPVFITDRFSQDQPNVERVIRDNFDHVCCWEEQWSDILSKFSASLKRE